MNAKEFKALAMKVANHYNVDFVTKKEILDWISDDGKTLTCLDDDTHVYVWCGNDFYSDERITMKLLKKADYIEMSYAEGWMWYIGRNCTESALDDSYDSTIGLYIEEEAIA